MKGIIIKELKSDIQIIKGFSLLNCAIIIVYVMFMNLIGSLFVYSSLKVLYTIFNIIVSIILVSPSAYNRKKKICHTILFFLKKDTDIYHPIHIDISERSGKDVF